ncbi:MAG TPA: PEP-CTERM sorting domain-containing protein [Phycisphaerae bacterium]|nr:PEP-CTERM sorting domain-containing protein [Phycisphaerae bacterium]HNU45876.1 PEP-CTERM sorting domain-containing protein [Phycisphaerae bacterium]
MRNGVFLVALAAVVVSMAGVAQGDPVPVNLVIKGGDALGGSTVSTLNSPFTDGHGKVGFVGALADDQRFVWHDTGPIFFSGSALPVVLTGGESTMGVSNSGGFIYSPSADGNDAVWTQGGGLLVEGQTLVNYPDLYSVFNSRPTMLPNGTAYWIGGTRLEDQTSTSNRHLLRASDPTNPATITTVLSGGDIIEGKAIKTTATNFTYWVSNNGLHHIHRLEMETGSTNNDMHMYVDGAFVAQEGQPTGQGDNWAGFSSVSINDFGNYVFSGDTSGPVATDAFVAYNGNIVVREGDTLDGILLASGYAVRDLSINKWGRVVHMWGTSTTEFLFFGEAADLSASQLLLRTGDQIDVDGDTVADFTVYDFKASSVVGPGLDLAEDGWVYVEADIDPVGGGTRVEAILGIWIPEPATLGLLLLGGVLVLRRR